MEISAFAVDLAKYKFQVHGYDRHGERVLAKALKRDQVVSFFEARPERCEVVMEACSGAHHWARRLEALGYRARLIPPQFVTPFLVGNKTDANDTDAIYEASRREKVRAVPVKSIEQQDALLVHATREQWVKMRTALVNQMRGELAERGIVFRKRIAALRSGVVGLLAQPASGDVTEAFRAWLLERQEDWRLLDRKIRECEQTLRAQYERTPACQQIGEASGIGVITATATVALVGNGHQFRRARQFAGWLGVTPKEHSSGERRQLGGLTKRGDTYLRKLYVHGGRSVVQAVLRKAKNNQPLTARERWIQAVAARRGFNKACVAVANKNARIVWAMLTTGECYRRDPAVAA